MTQTNDIPRVITDMPANGKSYTLTSAQKDRKKKGKTIYQRDRNVDEYSFSKGRFV